MKAGRVLLACVAWIAAGSLCAAEAELALAEGAACRQARLLAGEIRPELEAKLGAPLPGGVKAWGDYAAAALLANDVARAAWAGLKAAQAAWNGKTVSDAGIYLHHLDRNAQALQFLGCAREMGYRSPYLFEALALVHKAQGADAPAREAIAEAQRLAPGDSLIEVEASLIDTGQPPPPSPPPPDDGLGRCLAALERHSQRVLSVRKQNHRRFDRLENTDARTRAFAAEAQNHDGLLNAVREMARNARRAPADALQHNLALSQCGSAYFLFTGFLLESYYWVESAFALVFWADALGLDAQAFVRDLPCGSPGNVCDERGGAKSLKLASRAVEDALYHGRKEANRQYWDDIKGCRGLGGEAGSRCGLRARVKECATNRALIETWSNARQQRVNRARLNFDNEARAVVSLAEGEVGAAREFAVGLLRNLRKGGQSIPGPGGKAITAFDFAVQQINLAYVDGLLAPQLLAGGRVEDFLRGQGRWFAQERSWIEEGIMATKQAHDRLCEPVMLELRMAQLQEQWQAYLDHLRDRLKWGAESQVTTEFPCEFGIGPLSGEVDLNKPGEGKFDLKWKKGGFTATGSATAGQGGVKFTADAGAKVRGADIGVDSEGGSGVGHSTSYGPFSGKAKVTLTTKVNPYNSREYLGIRLKGSAGFGLGAKRGKTSLGASCYPSSGSVTVYPRALLEDAVRYMSATSR